MNFREANIEDEAKIVELLKLCLGEQDLPLSERIWNYKHLQNPFGKSIVFIAEDEGQIVGVRAFMQWKWQLGSRLYFALRSVDAATHPSYQRRGVFKKLTLKVLSQAKDLGKDFVFNTPNSKSLPGNLKLGWKTVDKIEVEFKPSWCSIWKSQKKIIYEVNITSENELENLCFRWNRQMEKGNKIFVPKNREYLAWRYEENPIQAYEVFCNNFLYIAAYIKERRGLRELRISEFIFCEIDNISSFARSVVRSMAIKFGAHVITFSSQLGNPLGWKVKGKFGPVLVLRIINSNKLKGKKIQQLEYWNYSLGDLELF